MTAPNLKTMPFKTFVFRLPSGERVFIEANEIDSALKKAYKQYGNLAGMENEGLPFITVKPLKED